mmetsp:Transcript_16351/g.30962  ORF Transcript_16351/g.30962 Transcript_16351/m.30962 type:complete len:250 (-) Transcript_16351:2408-3157(-)
MQSYKVSQRQRYFRLHDDSGASTIDKVIPRIDSSKNHSISPHGSNPFSPKPTAGCDWYDEYSSRHVKDERVNNSFPFAYSSRDLEYRDAQLLQGDQFRRGSHEDVRDGTEKSCRQAFKDSSNHRGDPAAFDIGDVCCYLHGVDQQVISPPRLTRSSMADTSSRIPRKKTHDISQAFPLQTRHTRTKDIKYETCRPIIPIYDHSYIGQPKFCIHRCRLPTQFLHILDQSKFSFIILQILKFYGFPHNRSF